jgi:ribosomal protein L19E
MNFGYGKEDNYKNERFITYTEAADILSLHSHSKIAELVKKGVVKSYQIPLTDRVRVRKSRILSLKQTSLDQFQSNDFEI